MTNWSWRVGHERACQVRIFVQKARILLSLNTDQSPKEVAETLKISTPTVFKWRSRFTKQGVTGLQNAPRPGQLRKLDRKTVKSILDDMVKNLPKESTHWSAWLMAEYAKISKGWQKIVLRSFSQQLNGNRIQLDGLGCQVTTARNYGMAICLSAAS